MGTRWTKVGNSSEGALAHALRRAVGRDQVGELRLEIAQLALEPVVLLVRDLGRGLDVVEVLVPADLLAQLRDALLGLLARPVNLRARAGRLSLSGRGRG